MFDITSSKLLLLGIVALLVIGPKDFPALLRTIGKYVGHHQAARQGVPRPVRRGHARVRAGAAQEGRGEDRRRRRRRPFSAAGQIGGADARGGAPERRCVARHGIRPPAPDPLAHDANGLPIAPPAAGAPKRQLRSTGRRTRARRRPPRPPSRDPGGGRRAGGPSGREDAEPEGGGRMQDKPGATRPSPAQARGPRRDRGVEGAADRPSDRAAPAPDLRADRRRHRLRSSASTSPRESTTCWSGPIRWRAGRGRRSR